METATAQTQEERPEALDASTLCEAFQTTAAERAEQVALRTPGDAVSITFGEYADRAERIAAGLDTLGLGRGDTVGLMLTNRPEFNLIDTGALHLGATPFSIYNTSAPEQIDYLFSNAENRVAVTERAFLPQILAARESSETLEHVVVVDGEEGEEETIQLAELEDMGGSGFDFEARWKAVEPGDVLTLIYTSGTTGPPKGVQLTHGNLMAGIAGATKRMPTAPGGRAVSYLPAAHIADRYLHYWASMCMGFSMTCVADPRTIAEHLPECRPSVWFSVPRIWEKIKAALEAQGITDPEALPEEQKAGIRAKLGLDQHEWVASGAAPIPVEVLHYFAGLGLPISELWGMSELTGLVTVSSPERIKPGTCGPPIEGTELRLAEDGEVLVRGPLVMAGYRNDPEKTAETIDAEGWLHTGDIGELDEDGYLKIVDRKKELIINAAGKNMSPANIEARLKAASPLIGQCIAIGDRRPYNVALIVLDPDVAAAFAKEQGLPDASAAALAENETVQAVVAAAVEEANSHLSRVEQVKRFKVLPTDWLPDSEELTPTQKLKRKPIAEKYAAEIEGLYAR